MPITVTVAQFRGNFKEFRSVKNYPDAQVTFWFGIAALRLTERWADMLDFGAQLFVAHNLAMQFRDEQEAANGAPPGQNVGPLNNKSVDKASAGYDTAAGTLEGQGHWNMTNYGTRFMELAQLVGAGPIQVGIGASPIGGGAFTNAGQSGDFENANGAWSGPWPWNFPNSSNSG